MSELRIALVAEGPTDEVLIKAALNAIMPAPFVLTLLQPEPTRPQLGGGWPGVLKWCHESVTRGHGVLEQDPTLQSYDMFILHLDADVADKTYADCGAEIVELSARHGWAALPCTAPCPPVDASAVNLKTVLLSWLQQAQVGDKTVLCIPSKAVESWLAAAVLTEDSPLLPCLECRPDMERQLALLPKKQRIKKQRMEYLKHAPTLSERWEHVCNLCCQARAFDQSVRAAII